MGLHYQLENNELGLCLACGLVIDGGEDGCVAYTEEGLEVLKTRGISVDLLENFFLAYKLHHYSYFTIDTSVAFAMIRTIHDFLLTEDNAENVSMRMPTDKTEFALQTATSPIFMFQILDSDTNEKTIALMKQYMHDILLAYQI